MRRGIIKVYPACRIARVPRDPLARLKMCDVKAIRHRKLAVRRNVHDNRRPPMDIFLGEMVPWVGCDWLLVHTDFSPCVWTCRSNHARIVPSRANRKRLPDHYRSPDLAELHQALQHPWHAGRYLAGQPACGPGCSRRRRPRLASRNRQG